MRLSLEIARRYLFGKKSTNAINLIAGISVLGISIGTAALILILSVFNGFESLITQFLDEYSPDIKIIPVSGKKFVIDSALYHLLQDSEEVAALSKTLEEVALFEYAGSQEPGIIKGVDESFAEVTSIESTIKSGQFLLKNADINYAVAGSGMARKLSLNLDNPFEEITIYIPQKNSRNPLDKDFRSKAVYPSGYFSIQNENDQQYMFADLNLVRSLLNLNNELSAIEIKLNNPANEKRAIRKLKSILGPEFIVQNRYDQDETYLKIMNIEKWMSFLIVSLTILIVAFNLIGCLWMIVLEKKKDIAILKSMGSNSNDIRNIFLFEGLLITGLGMLIGFVISLLFVAAQKEFGLIGMSEGFIVESYPIQLESFDFLVVSGVVLLIGFMASYLPAVKAAKIPAYIREE